MLIRNWMPFVRRLLRLRLISVFRGRDKLLRICFDPDREPEASLEFSFDGVRYPGFTAFLADWSAFFSGAYEKVSGWSSAGRICRDRVLCSCSIWRGNVGYHSLRFVAQGCKAGGFESNPALWPQSKTNAGFPALRALSHCIEWRWSRRAKHGLPACRREPTRALGSSCMNPVTGKVRMQRSTSVPHPTA